MSKIPVNKKYPTREAWLAEATRQLIPDVEQAAGGALFPENWLVGVTEPNRSAIGTAWPKQGGTHHLFISAQLVDPVEVLATLVHEMLHITVGIKFGHRGPFRKAALAIGLSGKMTATTAAPGTDLHAELKDLADTLGPYPNVRLKRQKRAAGGNGGWIRMESVTDSTYRVVVSPKQLESWGAPRDPDGEEMREVRK